MPYPARMDVVPCPKGSHARPSRGAKSSYLLGAILAPNGEVFPPTIMPLVDGLVPVPGMMLPVVGSIFGALAATYRPGSKLSKMPCESDGCPKNDQRTPM